jgi:hypothetical protein
MDLADKINAELELARAARQAGNEGRARVCARRAAGLAARDFLDQNGHPARDRDHTGSAYAALQTLAALPGLTPELVQAALHLTKRVSGEFQLPAGIDLIAEANILIGGLK